MIEFERVQLIRKRAATMLRHCNDCGAVSDVVSHTDAAELFETAPDHLFEFIEQNDCHYDVSYDGKTYLCVPSLIERMPRENNIRLGILEKQTTLVLGETLGSSHSNRSEDK